MAENREPDLFDKKLPQLVYELEAERDEEKRKAKEAKQTEVLVSLVSLALAGIISVGAFVLADRKPIVEGIAERIEQIQGREDTSDSKGKRDIQTEEADASADSGAASDITDEALTSSEGSQTEKRSENENGSENNDEIESNNKSENNNESGNNNEPKNNNDPQNSNKSENRQTDQTKTSDNPKKNKEKRNAKAKVYKTKSVYYNKKSKALSFDLDGKSYLFPVTAKELSKKKWTLVDENADPNGEDLIAATLYDKGGSTIFLYRSKDAEAAEKMELVLADKKSSFMGVTLKSTPKAVKKLLRRADKIKKDGLRKGNGRVLYAFGEYVIGVNYANGTAFSVSLEKGDIDG